jgi:hypothetical protein
MLGDTAGLSTASTGDCGPVAAGETGVDDVTAAERR